jgi:ABC-type nitrate/sulfonate/bicarbonate transport system substrate-binding protein
MQTVTKSSQPGMRPVLGGRRLRLGFVPLTDCAPLVVAQELGLFERHGVEVVLSRELGWATVRDKIIFGELHAAHALWPMVLQLALGLSGSPCACFTPLILSAQGNAITVSRRLWDAGIHDAASLHAWRGQSRQSEPLTFGIVFPYSCHHLLLRDWLGKAGLNVEREVKLVIVPPPQMVTNLKAGHLDGFCAGEPWGTLAVETGAGCSVARSAALDPLHPEKVLLIRQELLDQRKDECLALTAALLEACAYCAAPENSNTVADLLAQPRYLGISRSAIAASLRDDDSAATAEPRNGAPDVLFYGAEVNDPTLEKAGGLARRLRAAGLLPQSLTAPRLASLFRSDLYQQISQPNTNSLHHEMEKPNEASLAIS